MPVNKPGWLNGFSHRFSTQVFWRAGNAGYNRLRRRAPADFPVRLYWPFKPAPDRPLTPLVFAISPVVLPRPADWDSEHIHLPGYFFMDDHGYEPPETLHRFLEAGDPPICVTFGSMVNRESERITRAALDAVRSTGCRAIFLTGWGERQSERRQDSTLFMEAAPHDWLFSRCRAVVHHGGAGTTAAGLRAGVPSILIPHTADQPFWGSRVAAIGAGPKPIPVKQLTSGALAAAIKQADMEIIRRRAGEIGRLIRTENGVGETVALIEGHAQRFHRSG
jgi:UDP:flavonoid glycosyltransferase YjiC (YdhE family)